MWVTHSGGAGGRSPLAGARGVPAFSPHLPPQVARRGYLNSYRKSAIIWLIRERMHKIRCELVVLCFVEDSHFFHECKQGNHLISNKCVFDNCSHLFILDM